MTIDETMASFAVMGKNWGHAASWPNMNLRQSFSKGVVPLVKLSPFCLNFIFWPWASWWTII